MEMLCYPSAGGSVGIIFLFKYFFASVCVCVCFTDLFLTEKQLISLITTFRVPEVCLKVMLVYITHICVEEKPAA